VAAVLVAALLPVLTPAAATAAAPAYFTQVGSLQSVEFKGHRYFFADDDKHGLELWRTDGTKSGTQLLIDINPGDADSDSLKSDMLDRHYFVATSKNLYLFAPICTTETCSQSRSYSSGIYRVDVSGRKLVPIATGSYDVIANLGTKVVLKAFADNRLTIFDTTNEAVTEVSGFRTFIYDSLHPDVAATVLKGVAYFPAEDSAGDQELWRTDGTQAGTYRLKNIRSSSSSYPRGFVAGTNRFYFTADDGFSGNEIWTSDGTEKGTIRLTEHGVGTSGALFSATPPSWVTIGDRLYYYVSTTKYGLELWRTDGTKASVKIVRDLTPGAKGTSIKHMIRVGDKLAFFRPGTGGEDVWVTDGTSKGTVMVASGSGLGTTPAQPPYYRSIATEPVVVAGQLIYNRLQGLNKNIWQSGTVPTTTKRIASHANASGRPTQLLPVGNKLFYTIPTQDRTFAPTHYVPKFATITAVKPKLTKIPVPKVTGTAIVGKTLKAVPGAWAPAKVTLKYQWLRAGKAIKGATKSTYKLVKADAGKRITVKVTGSKSGYASASKTSKAVTALHALTKTPTPKITGTATVGKTLKAVPGAWAPAKVTLKYQWLRAGKAIKGATKSSYKLVSADKGKKVTVKVTGSKKNYKSVAKTSAAKTVR
jgi:ELWxxDGT repeat protein